MRDKQCDVIRRELEELTLKEDFSGATAEHLRGCTGCRDFQRQQVKLRQIIGSLGTVNAPADFDFRLRARLAADSEGSGVRYWSFAVRGLASVAVLVVFGVGAAIVWQSTRPGPAVAETPQLGQSQHVASKPTEPRPADLQKSDPVRPDERAGLVNEISVVADNLPRRNPGRPTVFTPRRPIVSVDRSSLRANVYPIAQPALDNATVFPIEGSLQSVKVSVDDGRGNARTISFPTVSFGSQRGLTTANQFAAQGVW